MKFSRIVLQVNMHRLTERNFRSEVTLSSWQPWRHFTQKCCHLASADTAPG